MPAALPAETNGSTTHAASTRPFSSAPIMSGNGISVYLSLETSTPFSSSVALIVTSQMLLSVLAAIVLPSRSFGLLMSDPLGISTSAHGSLASGPPRTPWETICTGSPLEAAISRETVLEKPMSKSPLMTAGVIAAPPAANCGSSLIPCSLKKPCLMPTNTGATSAIGISPILTVSGFSGVPPPPPPEPPSSPHPVATTAVAASIASAAVRRRILVSSRRLLPLDQPVDVRPQARELRQLLRVDLVARMRQVDAQHLAHLGRRGREHDDPVRQVDRLVDVVGHEQHGHAELLADAQHEVLQVAARLRVDGRERLVHQQDLGLVGERPRDRHPLLHAARQLPRVAVDEARKADRLDRLLDEPRRLALPELLVAQRQRDVAAHRHPRQQRARVLLEDQRHLGRRRRHPAATQLDRAGARLEQPGHALEQRRLAAARRADDADELLLGDREADRGDRVGGAVALPVRLAQL